MPTLRLSVLADPGAESEVARAILEESPWYAAVEIREQDALICSVSREAAAQAYGRSQGAAG